MRQIYYDRLFGNDEKYEKGKLYKVLVQTRWCSKNSFVDIPVGSILMYVGENAFKSACFLWQDNTEVLTNHSLLCQGIVRKI